MVIFDELFGSESLSQVYGILIDFLKTVTDKSALKYIVYDDVCHLAKFGLKPLLANKNITTKFFSERTFCIDKFNFKNHVDQYCIDNFDPYKIPELNDFNTEICEQLFKSVNSHSNYKTINEARYFLFWFYQMDLHNLDLEGMAGVLPNPHCDFRWTQFEIEKIDYGNLHPKTQIDNITEGLTNMQMEEKTIIKFELFSSCFTNESQLKKHVSSKHQT